MSQKNTKYANEDMLKRRDNNEQRTFNTVYMNKEEKKGTEKSLFLNVTISPDFRAVSLLVLF